jgi:hypothetical protein
VADAIFWGGLAAGVLDISAACAFWGLRAGATPQRIFQSVASGLLGREAFQGGWTTAGLGLVLHFFIATTAAAVFALASTRLPFLIRKPVLSGLAYGVGVYLFMTYVVLPLSAFNRASSFNLFLFLNGLVTHMLCVGLPIALATRYSARPGGTGPSTAAFAS